MSDLAARVQEETGDHVTLAYVDQGYTGEDARNAACSHDIRLEVVKLPEAKKGFVLLPRRWVVERSFAWVSRFRRLARDYERLPETVAGLTFLVFGILMLVKANQQRILPTTKIVRHGFPLENAIGEYKEYCPRLGSGKSNDRERNPPPPHCLP